MRAVKSFLFNDLILKLARALEMTPSDLLTDFTMAAVKRLRFDE